MVDTTTVLNDMLAFVEKAGALALANQGTAKHEFKEDASIVTETDLAISKMAQETFVDYLSQPDHLMIDEESIKKAGKPADAFTNSTYQWVMDPIDGTANYANGRSAFGTMICLLKNGQPLVSVLYQPACEKLVYGTAEGGVFSVKKAFTEEAEVTEISSWAPLPLHHQNYLEVWSDLLPRLDFTPLCWAHTPECSLQGGMYTLLSQNSGFLCSHIFSVWDLASTWSLIKMLGGTAYNFETKEPIEQLDATWFTPEWKARGGWFFGTEETLDKLYNAKI